MAVLALIFTAGSRGMAAPAPSETAREITARSNAYRARHGLHALRSDPTLASAALAFADYMARTNRYGHDADGRQPVERAKAAGYSHCKLAENIAWHVSSGGISSAALADAFVQGWIDSPSHRRNLLGAEATDVAIAVAHSAASGRWYAVQMLGRPASLRTRLELSNASQLIVRYRVDGQAFVLAPGVKRWHERCVAARVEVELPGAREPAVLNTESGARFRINASGELRQLR